MCDTGTDKGADRSMRIRKIGTMSGEGSGGGNGLQGPGTAGALQLVGVGQLMGELPA